MKENKVILIGILISLTLFSFLVIDVVRAEFGLTDHSVYNSDSNICSAEHLNMNVTVYDCNTYDSDGINIEQEVTFEWKGGSPQGTSWVFYYDQPLESTKMFIWKNISYQNYYEEEEYINDYLINGVSSYQNITHIEPNISNMLYCQLGTESNSNRFNVTYLDSTSRIVCFEEVSPLNATAFRVDGYANIKKNQTMYKMDWDDVSNEVDYLGDNLLGQGKSFYQVRNITFQPDQKIITKWIYNPFNRTKSGKWGIFGYDSSKTINQAITDEQYIYIDPSWQDTEYPYRVCFNLTSPSSNRFDEPVFINYTKLNENSPTNLPNADIDGFNVINNNSVEVPFEVIEINSPYGNHTDNNFSVENTLVVSVNATSGVSEEYCLYYGNSTGGNKETDFVYWFDDFSSNSTGNYTVYQATFIHNTTHQFLRASLSAGSNSMIVTSLDVNQTSNSYQVFATTRSVVASPNNDFFVGVGGWSLSRGTSRNNNNADGIVIDSYNEPNLYRIIDYDASISVLGSGSKNINIFNNWVDEILYLEDIDNSANVTYFQDGTPVVGFNTTAFSPKLGRPMMVAGASSFMEYDNFGAFAVWTHPRINNTMIVLTMGSEEDQGGGGDTTKPYFDHALADQNISNNQSLSYDINASDETSFDSFTINESSPFTIAIDTGILSNDSAMTVGTYYINVTINDSSNNINSSIILVNVSQGYVDTTPPYFEVIPADESVEYITSWSGVDFNATDETGFDSYAVNDTRFTIDSDGLLEWVAQLGVGEYYPNITINDSSNNLNSTIYNLNITKNNSLVLSTTETTPIEYPATTDFTGSGCPAELTCTLNISNAVYGVGTVSANYSTNGNDNYTDTSTEATITIEINDTLVLGNTVTSPITYGTTTDFTGSGCPAELTCTLNISNAVYGVGTVSANYSTNGNDNYTSQSVIATVTINQETGAGTLYIDHATSNKTVIQGTNVSLNGTLDTGSGDISLYVNGTLWNTGSSPLYNLTNFTDLDYYEIELNYTGNENYTSFSEYLYLNVTNISIPPTISDVSPSSGSSQSPSNATSGDVNFSADLSDDSGLSNITLYVYNETDLVINETEAIAGEPTSSFWSKVKSLAIGIYTWFIEVFDIDNNSSTSSNMTLTVASGNYYSSDYNWRDNFEDGTLNSTFWNSDTSNDNGCGGDVSSSITEVDGVVKISSYAYCPDGSGYSYADSKLWTKINNDILYNYSIVFMMNGTRNASNGAYNNFSVYISYGDDGSLDSFVDSLTEAEIEINPAINYTIVGNSTSIVLYRNNTEDLMGITDVNDSYEILFYSQSNVTADVAEAETANSTIYLYDYSSQIEDIILNLTSPVNYSSFLENETFNFTIEAPLFTDINATVNIWYQNGTIYNQTISNVTFPYLSITSIEVDNISTGIYDWNVYGCGTNPDNEVECVWSDNNFTIYSGIEIGDNLYPSSVVQTQTVDFNVTFEVISGTPTASLYYNGTEYVADTLTNTGGNTWRADEELTIPVEFEGDVDFFWSLDSGGQNFNTSVQTQSVSQLLFDFCNSTLNISFINFTFKDEGDDSDLSVQIPDSSFVYYVGDGTENITTTFLNNTQNPSYAFCGSPTDETINVDIYLQYKNGTSHPQRIYDPSVLALTNTTTNETLYLLGSGDGIYVTFQVINTAEQLLSGVDITANRTISGSIETVGQGTTGDDGTTTFWLNPDFIHTFLFEHDDYTSYTTSFAPTQTSYTVTLGGGSSTTASDYTRGITTSINPQDNELFNDTTYTFAFNVSSSYWELDSFGFYLRLDNGTIVDSDTSSTEDSPAEVDYDVNNQSIIYMDYYWIIEGNTTSGSKYWIITNTEYTEWSVKTLFADTNTYINSGVFGLDNFGRLVIIFLILLIAVGIMSYKFGVTSPIAVTSMIFAIVFFFDVVVGLIPTIRGIDYVVTYIAGLMLVAVILREVSR